MIENRAVMSDDYQMEVSITKEAINKLIEEKANSFKPKIEIWARYTTSKTSYRVRTLNSYLFKLMLRFSHVFNDSLDYLPFIAGKVDRTFEDVRSDYKKFGLLIIRPHVELNSWGVSSLIFSLPSLKIKKDEHVQDEKEKLIFVPIYILRNIYNERKFPMEIKISAKIAPNLLHMEMDYENGAWRFAAIQGI